MVDIEGKGDRFELINRAKKRIYSRVLTSAIDPMRLLSLMASCWDGSKKHFTRPVMRAKIYGICKTIKPISKD